MRLTSEQADTIRRRVHESLGDTCTIKLFGSRTDDSKRGGDIDLLIHCPSPVARRVQRETDLAACLEIDLGGYPVDVLILDPATRSLSVHEHAQLDGVPL